MNIPSGVEDATKEGKELGKKKGVTAVVGVLMTVLERCAPVGWRCHGTLQQLFSSRWSIISIISSVTVNHFSGQKGSLIDFLFGHSEDLCATNF